MTYLDRREWAIVSRREYDHLRDCYLSPLSGMRDLGAVLVREWGHDPDEHPELLAQLEVELSAAHVETAADLMREHGLRDLRVEPCAEQPIAP
ncbi:hypothetical protein ACIRQP_14845 [Streptomyces sp. NPDC102274]|uniref:hypothetical protein n=1 Tax=Streptomyces sp. NPDC102274 TaxID=3366151 RepID=UPI0038128D4A